MIAQGFPLAFRVASFALCLIACSCSRQEPLPVTPVPAQKPGTNVADGFFHSLTRFLIVFGADGFAPYSAPANPVRFTAIYYSAHWCPPCRAFTPKLVEWYKGFKSKHANFELVFASSDKDEAAMLDYMKESGMPWPAVKFGEKKAVGLDKYAAGGIPYLVLIDENGKDLTGKEGNDWQPPTEVLKKIEELVK